MSTVLNFDRKKKSPKAVCILFQALTTSIVIEFFPYKLV